ncbi:pilus assembly protein PilP [Neptuniibacter halophilus]|uniref:pilus assembly protein PilP n=1 Tax=Neptuniibacter halophilus TaxID=651666 RepID=UPI002573AA99|nr:pilus assembly protein PilP [Neptuniibacter halophilus]
MTRYTKMLLVALLTSILGGCVDWVESTDDLQVFVKEAQNRPPGRIEPLPEFKPYHSFVYEGASMREPFLPLVPVQADAEEPGGAVSEIVPDESREKEYLESFALDKLTMVGTITQREGEQLWALIQDANAEIHRVTLGNHMGLDFGEIVSLDERQIELVEIVANGRGGWMKRPRSLALREQE